MQIRRENVSKGIDNWFRKQGITNKHVIYETMANFCIANGFEGLNKQTKTSTIYLFCSNRFAKFAPYAKKFLTENNYL